MTSVARACRSNAFRCRECDKFTLLTELYSFYCKHNFQLMINRLQSDKYNYDEQCGLIYKTARCTCCMIKSNFITSNGYYSSDKYTIVTLRYNANASLWINKRIKVINKSMDTESCATCMSDY
jgi:hypothetical protein